jgi:hypothetical protein
MYCVETIDMVEFMEIRPSKEVSAAPIKRKRRPGCNRAADDPE